MFQPFMGPLDVCSDAGSAEGSVELGERRGSTEGAEKSGALREGAEKSGCGSAEGSRER